VSIVTTAKGPPARWQSDDLIRIEVRGRHTLLHIFPRLLAILTRERGNYSIIHCATFDYLSGLAVLIGKILRRPVVLRVATEYDVRQYADARDWKSRLFFRFLRGAATMIAPSDAIRNELLSAGFSDQKIFVLPNGVDVERFRPATPTEQSEAKKALNLTPDTLVIGTVARLVRRKGIEVLLQAFKTISQNHPTHLLVIGDGPLGDELRALASDLGIDRSVSWFGARRDPEIWLRAMDVFVFPSRLEGIPNAVLEAMATGLPIVATAIGGVVDLIQDRMTGIVIPPDDPDALAAALDQQLNDAALRADLGLRARVRAVGAFSLSGSISRVIDLYRALQCS